MRARCGRRVVGREGDQPVWSQSLSLALAGSFYPAGPVALAIYLSSARPRRAALFYLLGALIITAVAGAIVLIFLRGINIDQPGNGNARDGLRLGLGLVALVFAFVVYRRSRLSQKASPPGAVESQAVAAAEGLALATAVEESADASLLGESAAATEEPADAAASDEAANATASDEPADASAAGTGDAATAAGTPAKQPGFTERMTARPRAATVVLVGAISFIPGVAYLAAVQSIGNVSAGWATSALALLAVVLLDLWLVWVPVLLFLAAPDRTVAAVKTGNAWVRGHGRLLLAALLALVGVFLVISGIAGLVG